MGLILLIVVGGILGWLASIVVRADDRQGVLLNVATGIAGALIAGLLTNNGSVLAGLSPYALLAAFVGALAVLALVNVLRSRQAG
jgi:uncharacterized membrane protein YeaQ/YmgE (transglycosylase-associated protein family)